jgi:predicted ATPase
VSHQPVSPLSSPPDAAPPPAYFLSLTVENYRCFGPAQTLDLSDGEGRPAPWTIILGENGVGKTTLLQCLTKLRLTYDQKHSLWHFDQSGLDLWLWSKQGARIGNCSITQSIQLGNKLREDTLEGEQLSLNFRSQNNGYSSWTTRLNVGALISYGYGASRRMGKSNLSEQRSEDTTASLFSDDVDLINAEEWLLQADYAASRAKENDQAAQRRDQIKEILIDLLPDVMDIRFAESGNSLGTPTIEFHTPYGWVRLNGLSLGYRTLITWMVDLASRLFDRYPDSPNPLAEPAVVLVDEIDLHLHPRWQRTLMQFLSDRFPNAQFIATAHSPLVVQAAAADANLVLLRREGDHVVIDNDIEAIRNWRVDQILTSELFGLDSARPPQLDSLLDAREAILSKPRLSKRDQAQLQALETQIGTLPTGETPQDREAMDIIRRAAQLLQAK